MADPSPYGADHQRRRELAIEEAYNTPCPRCGLTMRKGQRLHFGHVEPLAMNPAAKAERIEHADYQDCPVGGNTADGGRLMHRLRDLRPSRDW